jgi:hypothetical protein
MAAACLFAGSQSSAAPELLFNAKAYSDSSMKTQLYSYKCEIDKHADGSADAVNTYSSIDGTIMGIETAHFDKDSKVAGYEMQQKQIGAQGKLTVSGTTLNFSYKKDGKEKTSTETDVTNFVVGPSILLFLRNNWDRILKGDVVKSRLAVLDRQETVGFEFSKERDGTVDGKKVVVVKMKPSSFIIAAVVDPLHFSIELDTKRLLALQGRSQMKRDVGGAFKDLDAYTRYEYVATP